MTPLLDSIRNAMSAPRWGRPVCIACGRGVSPRDESMRLRGGVIVHRGCATYDIGRRRAGADRLGHPRSGR